MAKVALGTAAVLAAAAFGASAHATTIFSDFGAGGSYNTSGAWLTEQSGTAWFASAAFTSSGDYDVSRIDLALVNSGGTNSAVVSLWTDVGGVGGTELKSWSVSGQPSSPGPLTSITGITGVSLKAGDSYFIQIAAGAPDTTDLWYLNDQGYRSDYYALTPAGSVSPEGQRIAGAFDVLGNAAAAPEPGAWIMILLGFFGLGAVLRTHRRSSRQIDATRACPM